MANNDITSYALRPGSVLAGGERQYFIESILGAGGFGVTYLATYAVVTGGIREIRRVAIKEHFMADYNERDAATQRVVTPGTARIQETVANSLKDFLSEARRLRQVGSRHPNIVRVEEVFEANDTAYYVMEYLEGTTLWGYIAGRPLDENTMLGIMMPIVDAVAFLHRERLTHLDVKPQNIMIVGTGTAARPVLIDFGLSKHYDANGNATSTVNTMASSDGYSPVEQYSGISRFSPASDVYALGATMLACLTGTTPTKSTEWGAGEPARTIMLLPASPTTCAAISCAMAPMAVNRYPDAGSLKAALGGSPLAVPPAPPVLPPSTATKVITPAPGTGAGAPAAPARRHGLGWLIAAAAVLILAVAGAVAAFFAFGDDEPADDWVAPDLIAANDSIAAGVPAEEPAPEPAVQEEEVLPEPQVTEIVIIEDDVIEEPEPAPAPPADDEIVDILPNRNAAVATEEEPIRERTYSIAMVEQKPMFPGGEAEMYRWLADHLVYPADAQEEGVQGRVVVEFTVEKDGSLSNIRIVRGRHPSLDREALRVVQSMPRWSPGRNNGEPVRVSYALPVTFRLTR